MTQTRQEGTRIVGRGVQRVDSAERLIGAAVFGADHTTKGTLYAKLVRSPYANARILSIDVSRPSPCPASAPSSRPPISPTSQ